MNRFHIKSLGHFLLFRRSACLVLLTAGRVVWLVMKDLPDDVRSMMIEANAANYAEGKKALFVTGLASQGADGTVCEHLKATASTGTDRK